MGDLDSTMSLSAMVMCCLSSRSSRPRPRTKRHVHCDPLFSRCLGPMVPRSLLVLRRPMTGSPPARLAKRGSRSVHPDRRPDRCELLPRSSGSLRPSPGRTPQRPGQRVDRRLRTVDSHDDDARCVHVISCSLRKPVPRSIRRSRTSSEKVLRKIAIGDGAGLSHGTTPRARRHWR